MTNNRGTRQIILAVAILISGCGQQAQEKKAVSTTSQTPGKENSALAGERSTLIVGKWKIDDIVSDINFSRAPEDKRAEYEQAANDHYALMKQLGYYEFFEDGKALTFDGKTEFPIRWRISTDGNNVCMRPENEVVENCLKIESINAGKIIMLYSDKDGEIRTTLVKDDTAQ